ncbi:thioredoxin [Ruminococcaceae bacterium CPB6]|jgi:thioredoxin 1|uniref:Thioredoxin n=2 Tax=Oscillospiraceae TaxID=216572 RepID=A0A859DPS8_9FIRM|nr:thioredoxin [Caproicibacterium lactatifermentans]ARP50440.1 thioredoxin [Ruminococcaceae bacterium CPB6]MDD4807273.1 thioredoxin [Oscillospiraceae bacterium]QKN23838.1 thioredoxin [Caproicibacterium lactatifermentans]QKO31090.1 thioredoxin [Caproicibacterium lactatifermentans]
MADVIHADEASFDKTLKENKVVLCDFWATWCGPCRMLAPTIEQLAQEYSGRVTVMKVDVDQNQKLAEKYNIMSIPTVYVFRDGAPADSRVGAFPIDDYRKMLDAVL